MANYYLLARAYRSNHELLDGVPRELETWQSLAEEPEQKEDLSWPYQVSISFDDEDAAMPICIHEGSGGHCSYTDYGTAVDVFSKPGWMDIIEKSHGLWLIPYLEKMAKGERFSKHYLLNEYKKHQAKNTSSFIKASAAKDPVFYHLAHGKAILNKASATPSDIYISFDGLSQPIDLSHGNGYDYQWTRVSANDALEIKRLKNFEDADGLWLLPYIQRMANGETLILEEVSAKYHSIHGDVPKAY